MNQPLDPGKTLARRQARQQMLRRGLRGLVRAWWSKGRLPALALLAAFVVLRLWDPYPVQFLRVKAFDMYQRLQPREVYERRPVTIVDIDEESLARIGQWPWSRATVADMVVNLANMGALVIGFDVVFAEPDRVSPGSVADTLPTLSEGLRQELKTLPSNDAILADVIKQSGRVVLGHATYKDPRPQKEGHPIPATPAWRPGPPQPQFLPEAVALVRNLPVLEQAAAGVGLFSLLPEPDGVVRRVPMMMRFDGRTYPSLSLEMLRVLFQRSTYVIQHDDLGISGLKVHPQLIAIPTDEKGRVWPYFSARDPEKYVPAWEIISGTASEETIRNKIAGHLVLVGTSATGLLDIRSTPTEAFMPGVEVHAQLLEAVLEPLWPMLMGEAEGPVGEQAFLARPGYLLGAEIIFLSLGGLLMIWLVPAVGARWTMALFAVMAGGAAVSSWYLFTQDLILLDAAYPIIALLLIYTLLTYAGYANEEAQRAQVRGAFSRYMSPALVERLAEDPTQLKLGGEMREMTLLFCDVRGFTSISELFDAEGLTRLINKFLTPLTDVILQRRGTIDKYMGDCIMAFWNAPLDDERHALHGCISALQMMKDLETVNQQLEREAIEEGRKHIPLRIGIGLNTGVCCVGNMGSEQRFDYSVLGDPVNLASRLEGQSKTYGVDIVIGEKTEAQVPELATLELDLIKVKGKAQAVRIFAVVGDEDDKRGDAFAALKAEHDAMLKAYRAQQWNEARARMAVCRNMVEDGHFNIAKFYDLYEERIGVFEANPPDPEWDGVFVATSK